MRDNASDPEKPHSRRAVLLGMGLGLTALGCTAPEQAGPGPSGPDGPSTRPGCVLTPEGTEGPYYLDTDLHRADITDGRPGVPLRLRITLVAAASCGPIHGGAVDIWHADAGGRYSGFENDRDSRFLRGVQVTDAAGAVEFTTIVPGWYDNRTAHIHVKAFVGGRETHTGQLYFSEDVISAVTRVRPYSDRTDPRTDNANDFLFGRSGDNSILTVTATAASGYLAQITLGVRV
ncbi:intradiol ring-cleavage dioxygenase [Actinokineospora iranica]|uniref:Dioxygenase n=1 Tax=Actinokineospora iranica TaxID=1271860 RepID=A0A1G6S5S5_9PSEU|nr:intradiol ring-cleavage dioxygenase [Actinokineospora iranica]SDD12031.1 Dioxygenase [Actinokineospora iranica]